jgi:hypothetical protein
MAESIVSGVRCGGEVFPMSASNWGRVNRAAGYYSIQMGFAITSATPFSEFKGSAQDEPVTSLLTFA